MCLAVEMGCEPLDIRKIIHPHPTWCGSIGLAAEVFEDIWTDLPPTKEALGPFRSAVRASEE